MDIELVAERVREDMRRAGFDLCACHRRVRGACPGPDAVGAVAAGPVLGAAVARIIDQTCLRMDATAADIDRLCDEAGTHHFATVCVNPAWVSRAAGRLAGTPVGVASVVGFPLGSTFPAVKAHEANEALAAGATEIDMVMNVGWLKSGELQAALLEVIEVARICRDRRAGVKAILETALLTEAEKVTAAVLAQAAGAAFVKTSTGLGPSGATVADVALLRAVVGPALGIKASGGIRDYDTVVRLVEAGATRIGTSSGVAIVNEGRRRGSGGRHAPDEAPGSAAEASK